MTATTLRAAATRLRTLGTDSARALAIAEVGCPRCLAPPGSGCVKAGGGWPGPSTEIHVDRYRVGVKYRTAFGLLLPAELVADLLDVIEADVGTSSLAYHAALNLARALLGNNEGDS